MKFKYFTLLLVLLLFSSIAYAETNIGLNKFSDSSCETHAPGNGGAKAVDGNDGTYWQCDTANSWHKIDLGVNVTGQVTTIFGDTDFGWDFTHLTLEASNDDSSWDPIFTSEACASGSGCIVDGYSVTGNYRYWRLTISSSSHTAVTEYHYNGTIYVPPTVFEYPYEETDQLTQTSTVTVSSNSPVTILSGTFPAVPNTNAYVSYSGNIRPTQTPVGDQKCYLEVNGNFVSNSNVSYTGTALNSYKSFYKLSNNFTVTQENNTIAMLCYGSSNKNFDVLNTVIDIHNLVNTTDYNYTLYSLPGSFSVNNLTNFVPVITGAIPVTGFNTSNTNKSTYVIFDVNNQIEYDITNTAKGYLVVNNFTCPALTRYGAAGETGSSSYICARSLENESLINYTLYFKGDVNVDFQAFIKEIVLEDYEIRNCYINDYDIISENFTNIDSQNITLDTNTKDIYTIASLSLSPNAINQEAIFRFKIESENGTIMYRDLNVINQSGVSTNQYLFTGLSADTYNITLQGRINSTVPNTTIVNGSILYMAVGESDLFPNTFTITAKDNLIGTFLSTFRVKDGLDLTTTTGSIEYPKQSGLINLTFSANNYFNYTIYNYNTSSNLQFNVTPNPWVNFTAEDYFTNNSISNFNISCINQTSQTTTGNNILFQLNDNITAIYCNFTHANYSNTYFNITNITWSSVNEYTIRSFTTNSVSFYFRDAITNALITSNVFISLLNSDITGDNYESNTTTGFTYIDLISPSLYTGIVSTSGYSDAEVSITVQQKTTQQKTVFLFPAANSSSLQFTIVDNIGGRLEDYILQTLQFYNESWRVIAECITNANGQCSQSLEIDEYYRHYVYDSNSNLLLTTDAEKITSSDVTNGKTITVTVIESQIGEFISYDNITVIDWSYTNTSTNTTNNFSFRLEASYTPVDQLCIEVSRIGISGEVVVCQSCMSEPTTTTYCDVILESDEDYVARIKSVLNNNDYYISNPKPFYFFFRSAKDIFDLEGVFYTLLICLLLASFGLSQGDAWLTIGGLITGLSVSSWLGFMPIPFEATLVLLLITAGVIIKTRGVGK